MVAGVKASLRGRIEALAAGVHWNLVSVLRMAVMWETTREHSLIKRR